MGVRVVSFSLFGDDPFYLVGAVENAIAIRQYYPGWEVRFYFSSSTVPTKTVTDLTQHGARLIAMSQRGQFDGTMWRFLPLHDLEVEIWVSRDADSRPSTRERLAVDEWLASGRTAHLMRDHPAHGAPIMGGMFGIDNRRMRRRSALPSVKNFLDRWNPSRDHYGIDQEWLRDSLWPLIKKDHVAHDAHNHFRTGLERPFPVPALPSESRFVGERIHVHSSNFRPSGPIQPPVLIVSPSRCRLRQPIRRLVSGMNTPLNGKDTRQSGV